ncbi:uncharacterized protein LOC131220763 isoform X2 [Magnolia sinica]|uniref:uncharacterized protein LOC131220763 isoform X2 n=1 Tax=Magnolia sinica TaxID=86752 RepID=UPI00265AC0B0|nr:uncharacterized protein LOC131220763 isoform X2 [Magnolia sinica]
MFWRMAGLSTTSPVEFILDKENYTLEELLDEDEIIQECKALNGRLINFLRQRSQVEQLLRYIVEEAPEDAEKRRTFKFPFIACEIFTCEVDIILKALVEDEELMHLLFSFLEPDRSHSSLLAGYFSKAHPEIFRQLVDLIGITSIMEVLIRLMGADEHIYSNYMDSKQWLQDSDVLEMILNKFSSSDSPEVHANAAEILCAITRFSPPGLAAKISCPSFVGRLFRHALEDSRPKSVLVHSLSVCISLLDPRRLATAPYHLFRGQMAQGSSATANPETVEGMLESLGDLLKLLDVSSGETVLLTTYGKLQPPLGKHRLKIVEFISVLLTIGSEAAEKELIRLGAIQQILDLFFEYPYNNFLHHHVENIIVSCLESKNGLLIDHLLQDCDLVGKILRAEKHSTLSTDSNKPTMPTEERSPPKIGNIGHLTRISNKLVQLENNNSKIQAHLQENSEWLDWHTNVLLKRNAVENVYQWACGRPTSLQDRTRDSDDDEFRDRDYDVAALANNLSQAFRYGIYSNDGIEEAHGSLERDDEDVYFDDESAEVVISSLRLGDDQDSGSLFTNSNWFAFEDNRVVNERSSGSLSSPSPSMEETGPMGSSSSSDDEVAVGGDDDLVDTAMPSKEPGPGSNLEKVGDGVSDNGVIEELKEDTRPSISSEGNNPPEWVEWRETPDSGDRSDVDLPPAITPNGEVEVEAKDQNCDEMDTDSGGPSPSSCDVAANRGNVDAGGSENPSSEQAGPSDGDPSSDASPPEGAKQDVKKTGGTEGGSDGS